MYKALLWAPSNILMPKFDRKRHKAWTKREVTIYHYKKIYWHRDNVKQLKQQYLSLLTYTGGQLWVFLQPCGECLSFYVPLPNSKVHGANMGPSWVLSALDGPHVGPINLAIKVVIFHVGGDNGVSSVINNVQASWEWLDSAMFLYTTHCIFSLYINIYDVDEFLVPIISYIYDIISLYP